MSMFTGTMIDYWRVDPGQNRGSGECITRKMTPEEKEYYSKMDIKPYKRPVILETGDKVRRRRVKNVK